MNLEPRRAELRTLLATLDDETVERTDVSNRRRPHCQRRHAAAIVARQRLCAVLVLPMFLVDSLIPYPDYRPFPSNRGTPASFAHLVTDLRREKKLVGLAAMVAVDGKVVASAVDGERKTGSGVPVELTDEWHLGGDHDLDHGHDDRALDRESPARMVDHGRRVLPRRSDARRLEVGHVRRAANPHLRRTAALPTEVNAEEPGLGPECTVARREAVLEVLAKKPDNPPGEKFVYSNVGPTIAAAMAEKKTGAAWEELVNQRSFRAARAHQRRLWTTEKPGRHTSAAARSPALSRHKIPAGRRQR